jgi:hypothetical protein
MYVSYENDHGKVGHNDVMEELGFGGRYRF